RAKSSMAVLKRVCEETPPSLTQVNPQVPDWLDAIINRLMQKAPADRFQTAAEVAGVLGEHLAILQGRGLTVARLPARPAERPFRGRRGGRGSGLSGWPGGGARGGGRAAGGGGGGGWGRGGRGGGGGTRRGLGGGPQPPPQQADLPEIPVPDPVELAARPSAA